MQPKKEQTATGFLAAILIGVIIGSLGAYPINQLRVERLASAQSILLEQLEILTVETKAWVIAETGTVKESDDAEEELIFPLIDRLRNESKTDPGKKLLIENTLCQLSGPININQAFRREVRQILKEGEIARQRKLITPPPGEEQQ